MDNVIDPRLEAIIQEVGAVNVLEAVAATFDYQFNGEAIVRPPREHARIERLLHSIEKTIGWRLITY